MRRAGLLVSAFPVAAVLVATPAVTTQAAAGPAAGPRIAQVSADPFTNASAQHATEVEPDTVTAGREVMSVFQVGRISSGCADDMGWAFSGNGGRTWRHGFMPGLTKVSRPAGPFDRVSDPTVAYDSRAREWIAASLDCNNPGPQTPAVSVSISANGVRWSAPVIVARAGSGQDYDKPWITCDDTARSRFFGNCYVEWDMDSRGDLVLMSTSRDGGRRWSAPVATASKLHGLGGEPVVLHNGDVVVPITAVLVSPLELVAFRSTDGGRTWGRTILISKLSQHFDAGNVRGPGFPGIGQDATGRIYLAWNDCRFRARCASNDMVMSTSVDGLRWTPVVRIPIDPVTSTVDHLGGGLGVDPASSGKHARLGLFYYFYPDTKCTTATCQVFEGFVSSTDGGVRWSAPTVLAGPFRLPQLAFAQGFMTGDYQGAAVVARGNAVSAFAVGGTPVGGQKLNEAMFEPVDGQPITGGSLQASAAGARAYRPTRIAGIIRLFRISSSP